MHQSYITIIVAIIFLGCKSAPENVKPEETEPADYVTITPAQMQTASIDTGKITRRQMNAAIRVNGVVDVPPQNIVSISFPMGGYLKSTRLMPGMYVNKGQIIATMEDPALIQLQQDYLMAAARLSYLEKDYQRQKMLNENQVNAEKVFQQATTDYNSQRILVKGLAEKLRLININPARLSESTISRTVAIYAPINGYVSSVKVNVGKYVSPSEVMFELINPQNLHAMLTVFEKDISRLRIGQKVLVNFVNDTATTYSCKVMLINRSIDDSRSSQVHCEFETKPEKLLPGMFLNAQINISEAEVLVVPDEALVRYGSQDYIFLSVSPYTYKMLPVIAGMREQGYVEIQYQQENLEGKTIINKNSYAVLSSMMNTNEEE